MPGHQLTQSEYALQRSVESFGNLLFTLEELHLNHIYMAVFQFYKLKNIMLLVMRYLNTGVVPFKKYSKDWSFDGKELLTSTSEIVTG
jgi:hypothetical protein